MDVPDLYLPLPSAARLPLAAGIGETEERPVVLPPVRICNRTLDCRRRSFWCELCKETVGCRWIDKEQPMPDPEVLIEAVDSASRLASAPVVLDR
jgi:hypothetical protein